MKPSLFIAALGTFVLCNILFSMLENADVEGGLKANEHIINAQLYTDHSLPAPFNIIRFPLPSGSFFSLLFTIIAWDYAMFYNNQWMSYIRLPFLLVSGAVLWGVLTVMVPIALNAISTMRRFIPIPGG